MRMVIEALLQHPRVITRPHIANQLKTHRQLLEEKAHSTNQLRSIHQKLVEIREVLLKVDVRLASHEALLQHSRVITRPHIANQLKTHRQLLEEKAHSTNQLRSIYQKLVEIREVLLKVDVRLASHATANDVCVCV